MACFPSPSADSPEATPPPEVATQVTKAREDLAQKKNLTADQIRLVRVEPTVFNDSSMGCPEPGQMYMQVLTPGWIIELQAQGTSYEYHAGRGERVVRCDGK